MPIKHTALALALGIGCVTHAGALDLVEAWQGASTHAPEASLEVATREAGAARARQARALWRPSVTLEGGAAYAGSESSVRGAQFAAPGFGQSNGVSFDTSVSGGTSSSYALALRQPVYSRERDARAQALQLAGEAAQVEGASIRQALMLRTAQAYFDAALAGERLRLLARQQQSVEQAAREAQDRFRLGDRPVTDVHEAAARAAALQAERLGAQNRLALALRALAELTGRPAAELERAPLPLPGDADAAELGALDDWLARADRQSPALRLAQAQLQTLEARSRASRAAFSPTVDVVARVGGERIGGDGDFGHASSSGRQQAIGVQVAVPLFTGGMRTAQGDEDSALADKSRAALERARLDVAQQTRAAWLDLWAGPGQLRALDAALAASRLRLDATRVGLHAGDRTTLDLLNAENDAAAARLALVSARVRLLTERLQLALLAGELDEPALRRANALLRPFDDQ